MGNDWKDKLRSLFEDLEIISRSKEETIEKFEHFCEFVAEPAFESLKEEFRTFGIKMKFKKEKGKSVAFQINFPKSSIDNFHYIIILPKNSIDLRLKLKIIGRKSKKSPPLEREEPIMENVSASEILNYKKENLIDNIITLYRDFIFEAFTHPD